MKSTLKRIANNLLAPIGLQVTRKIRDGEATHPLQHAMPTCEDRLAQAASIGFQARQIVDAGAFRGDWTLKVNQIFPDADFLVIEPNPHIQPILQESLKPLNSRVNIVQNAVADEVSSMLLP